MNAIVDPRAATGDDILLRVRGLKKYFSIRGGIFNRVVANVRAINDVSFSIKRGEVVGLVGESGSGKTTVGRTVLRLLEPTEGEINFAGTDITRLSASEMRAFRKRMQIVFQDPYASLNPREKVRTVLGHALAVHKIGRPEEREDRIVALLEQVGLSGDYLDRFPHEFSGGQRQRIGIARALAVEPEFIVADEPVSALDVSIQAQVVNLLEDLKAHYNLTMLFIAHDLAVVEHISDRVIVMYLGRIMEVAPTRNLYRVPNHPYTKALLSAVPDPDKRARPDRIILKGDIPSPINPPSGCVFRTRCSLAIADCARVVPSLNEISPGHFSACIRTAPTPGDVAVPSLIQEHL
ncbi:ABC transporter ATP-binding protein [Hoeflea sp. 108]|jgi:oligopeptide/dipeptide ABC transporter ATP-binding protein|uniref:ABC transporter ATP-binding protein n=1 Tax=Hoeflea sp. 108 TaxID=1116369 RepID=UPI0003680448|nr:ABC transporter ATP-binding protein [Hoeflea sp. 108]